MHPRNATHKVVRDFILSVYQTCVLESGVGLNLHMPGTNESLNMLKAIKALTNIPGGTHT